MQGHGIVTFPPECLATNPNFLLFSQVSRRSILHLSAPRWTILRFAHSSYNSSILFFDSLILSLLNTTDLPPMYPWLTSPPPPIFPTSANTYLPSPTTRPTLHSRPRHAGSSVPQSLLFFSSSLSPASSTSARDHHTSLENHSLHFGMASKLRRP